MLKAKNLTFFPVFYSLMLSSCIVDINDQDDPPRTPPPPTIPGLEAAHYPYCTPSTTANSVKPTNEQSEANNKSLAAPDVNKADVGILAHNSYNIQTSNIKPGIYISNYSDSLTKIRAKFNIADHWDPDCLDIIEILKGNCDMGNIKLRNGDYAAAEVAGLEYPLTIQRTNNYRDLNFSTEGQSLKIPLFRQNHVDAPNSVVLMPPGFNFQLPAQNTFNHNDLIPITWAPANMPTSSFTATSYISCGVQGKSYGYSAPRQLTSQDSGLLDANIPYLMIDWSIRTQEKMNLNQPCGLRIEFNRTNKGSIDPNYARGGIQANYIRSVNFCVDPSDYADPIP